MIRIELAQGTRMASWDGSRSIQIDRDGFGFDYDRQAWVEAFRYVKCGHVEDCTCYGRSHAGELAVDLTA